MNGFVGWVLFITVNCLTPQMDAPDIYVIKAAHPDFGPIQATIVMCEKTFDAGIPDRYRQPRQGRQTNVGIGSEPDDAITPHSDAWLAEYSRYGQRDPQTPIHGGDYQSGWQRHLGDISTGN